MQLKHRQCAALPLTALAALVLLVSGCGGHSAKGTAATTLTAATVDCRGLGLTAPAGIKAAGNLVLASALSYAPIDFTAEGSTEPLGLDIDIAKCITSAWGVTIEVQDISFDQVLPALAGKKVDIVMAALSDTPERRQQVDFVDYFNAGSGILVKSGNPRKISTMKDLCGRNVGIQAATTQLAEAAQQNESCGGNPINVTTFAHNDDSIDALVAGKVEAALMDYPVAIYTPTKVGGVEVAGGQFGTGPYGIAVRKDDAELRAALDTAITAMRAKGQYDAILKYWGLAAGKLP